MALTFKVNNLNYSTDNLLQSIGISIFDNLTPIVTCPTSNFSTSISGFNSGTEYFKYTTDTLTATLATDCSSISFTPNLIEKDNYLIIVSNTTGTITNYARDILILKDSLISNTTVNYYSKIPVGKYEISVDSIFISGTIVTIPHATLSSEKSYLVKVADKIQPFFVRITDTNPNVLKYELSITEKKI